MVGGAKGLAIGPLDVVGAADRLRIDRFDLALIVPLYDSPFDL